jgi:hypothetical protein
MAGWLSIALHLGCVGRNYLNLARQESSTRPREERLVAAGLFPYQENLETCENLYQSFENLEKLLFSVKVLKHKRPWESFHW